MTAVVITMLTTGHKMQNDSILCHFKLGLVREFSGYLVGTLCHLMYQKSESEITLVLLSCIRSLYSDLLKSFVEMGWAGRGRGGLEIKICEPRDGKIFLLKGSHSNVPMPFWNRNIVYIGSINGAHDLNLSFPFSVFPQQALAPRRNVLRYGFVIYYTETNQVPSFSELLQ